MGICYGDILIHSSHPQRYTTHKQWSSARTHSDTKKGRARREICWSKERRCGQHMPVKSVWWPNWHTSNCLFLCLCPIGCFVHFSLLFNLLVFFFVRIQYILFGGRTPRDPFYHIIRLPSWVQLHLNFFCSFHLQANHGPVLSYLAFIDQWRVCSENEVFLGVKHKNTSTVVALSHMHIRKTKSRKYKRHESRIRGCSCTRVVRTERDISKERRNM